MKRLATYADGILMILAGVTFAIMLMLVPDAGATAHDQDTLARRDFDSLVHAIAERYQIHAEPVPMMWLANLCARSATHGGVRGMKVVEFEGVSNMDNAGRLQLGELVKDRLGKRWSTLVRQHEESGGDSFVYVQSEDSGKQTRMILVDLNSGNHGDELDLVRMTLNPEQLSSWMKEEEAKDRRPRNARQ